MNAKQQKKQDVNNLTQAHHIKTQPIITLKPVYF